MGWLGKPREKCNKSPMLTNQIIGGFNAPQIPDVLKKLSSTFLSLCLCGASVALALDRPAPEKPAAMKDNADANGNRTAAETVTAIEALGAKPGTKQISTIVFKAVRSSPESVLAIVHAAVRVSPQAAVPEIVIAATAAVPNPWKQVAWRRLTAPDVKKSAPDFKGGPDGKSVRSPAEPGDGTMTLAEAIAQTAFDAQPGIPLFTLHAAVDIALLTDPATLLRQIQSPRTLSGVGDAGSSNYANEPLRPPVAGSTPVPTPNQPAVSQ